MDDPVSWEDSEMHPDDEEADRRQDEALRAINYFIDDYLDSREGHMYVYEFGMWLYALVYRMRQSMKFAELGRYVVGILNLTEIALENLKEQGDDIILAEDWRDMEGGLEMVRAIRETKRNQDLLVPQDWTLEEE